MIISSCLTNDNKFLLTNTSYKNPELHLWNLKSLQIVSRFEGHFQEKYLLRCTIGGLDENFIACGSEGLLFNYLMILDNNIYIWHRNSPKPIEVLKSHTSIVFSFLFTHFR